MTILVFHVDAGKVPAHPPEGEVHVLLYSGRPAHPGTAAIAGRLRDDASRFGIQPSQAAVDLVSVALAVTAADTFVLRDAAENGWSRNLHLVLPLGAPKVWNYVRDQLRDALRFLSGDQWTFEFHSGGERPPTQFAVKTRQRIVDLTAVDCVSLFSGGLDSAIGALDLLADGKRPLLVSHAYRGDSQYQTTVAELLPKRAQRFSVNAWPTWEGPTDESMRTRSFNFIAFAVLAAQVRSSLRNGAKTEVIIPENGLIALNAPLTPRRIGALSTRTTHPHFLSSLQRILDQIGLPVTLTNPYETMTKGEMVAREANRPNIGPFVGATVSCGKWKRQNQQCGRCVPCLIRRASVYAGCVDDQTSYESPDLHDILKREDHRDDLMAMMTAVGRLGSTDVVRWVARSGPLPADEHRRRALVDVHRRGILEVGTFLRDSGFPV